ncbi:hypothetical protein [Ruegeria sp.]|uniref:hypothetical protein n=1 Tax=Ruegeria sp. TaxID=1879320 RepID=UPI003B59A8C5
MDITVHFGAHRCATSSFQDYLQRNASALSQQGVAVWDRTALGEMDLHGLRSMTPDTYRALQHGLDRCQDQGINHLLITEENFLGMMPENFSKGELYPSAGSRALLVSEAFGGRVTQIALNIRALNTYWTSIAGYAVRNKKRFGESMRWAKIAQHPRSWRDVITDLNAAFPNVPLLVLPFEEFAGRPDLQLASVLGSSVPTDSVDMWINKDGNEAIQGPNSVQDMQLMMKFADDLSWLESGADGLARLCLRQETERDADASAEETDERITS